MPETEIYKYLKINAGKDTPMLPALPDLNI